MRSSVAGIRVTLFLRKSRSIMTDVVQNESRWIAGSFVIMQSMANVATRQSDAKFGYLRYNSYAVEPDNLRTPIHR